MLTLKRISTKNGKFLGEVEILAQSKMTAELIAETISKDATGLGISAMYSIDLVINSRFGSDCVPIIVAREINAEKAGIRVEYILRWDDSYIPF